MKLCDDEAHSCSGLSQTAKQLAESLSYTIVSVSTDVNYIFGTYTGILLTSTLYFIIYAAFKRNQPVVYPRVIIPALVAGIMWGIAMGEAVYSKELENSFYVFSFSLHTHMHTVGWFWRTNTCLLKLHFQW